MAEIGYGQGRERLTEDILIECAKLANSGKSSRSSNSRGSKDHVEVSEETLISNAVLVKDVSAKTESTVTVNTETTDCSVEDDIFDHQENQGAETTLNRGHTGVRRISDIKNYNIPEAKVTLANVEDLNLNSANVFPTDLREELKQTLPNTNNRQDVVPRLNFDYLGDQPVGCRTPINSEDDHLATLETELINRTNIADKIKQDWTKVERKGTTNESKPLKFSHENRNQMQKSLDHEPLDHDFDELVVDIANAMTTPMFEAAKSALKGLDCMTEQDLILCSSPLTYLNHLRKYGLVSRDNLAHLQYIVNLSNNPEVQQKAMLYTRYKFEVVFFYPTRDNIPSSYEVAKCHVMGRDFTRLKRSELETIRAGIANLLFIPSDFVYIVGIEPGFSVIVSVMLHNRYIGWFRDVLSENISQIAKFGIDAVQLGGRTFALGEDNRVGGIESEYNTHAFLSVFNQLKDKNKKLEEKDDEIVRLSQEAEFMQLELDTMSAELEVLTERAIQQTVTLRKPPKRERRFTRHGRSYSEPIPDVPNRYRGVTPYFWYVWVKPSTTSGYEVDRSLQNLADDIKTLENGNPESPVVDLDVSSAEFKDKDTLMGEIEQLLIELGARKM